MRSAFLLVTTFVVALALACGTSSTDSGPVGPDAGPPSDGSLRTDSSPDVAPSNDGGSGGADADAHGPARLVAYASGYGPNIDAFSVNATTGALTPAGSIASFGSSPSFLAVNPSATNLYALDESASGQVGAYSIDAATGALTFLDAVSSAGNGPAHVAVDRTGKFVMVANYGDGTVAVLPVQAGGRVGDAVDTHTAGAFAHMIAPDPSNRFVFVPCKGADYVAQFLFDATTGKLTPNAVTQVATAPGAGPRHLAFHPGGRFAYLINETNSTMTAYTLDATAGTLTEIETQSTLPSGFSGTNTAAEVWVHPSGSWLLGSNRGDDSIVVYAIDAASGKMTLKGFTKSGGMTPRDFTLDPGGALLYAANQDSSSVVPFRFDAAQGTLAALAMAVPVTSATFVGVVALPGP